jgi:5'-AMP-activated protein kinase catalytic alpha subunit
MERPLRDDRNGVEFFEGRLLERHTPPTSSPNELFFIRTCTKVTIKVMSNHRISEGSKEVAAMQYLQRHVSQDEEKREAGVQQMIARVENVLKSHHIIPCVEALYDSGESEGELYIIMPFFEDKKYLLTEPEARNCLKQILKGVETLQEAGVCSRNLRLENIVVRDDTFAIVMDSADFAFAIKIPYIINENGIRQRCRIKADRACGKHYYMSPEIWESVEPFDGHAVDVWALGPILFMMVCGMPPWHTAAFFDENFRYFSAGHFEQLAIERFEISAELSNLLQGMFWLNPEDRLSLGQIRDHPWMALPNENMR